MIIFIRMGGYKVRRYKGYGCGLGVPGWIVLVLYIIILVGLNVYNVMRL